MVQLINSILGISRPSSAANKNGGNSNGDSNTSMVSAGWRSRAGMRRIMLLLLFVVVVLLGQTVWAAGYRPPRTLGDWHHRAALGAPTTPAAAVPSKAAASGSNTAATTAAPQPAKAAAVPPEDADYWQAAKGSKQQPPSASSDAAAATSQQQQQPQQQPDPSIDSSGGVDDDDSVPWKPREADITPQEEAVQLAEAEARAAQDFAAVHSLNGEEEQEEEQLVDAAAAAAAGGDAAQQPPQQQLPGATTAASTPAAVPAGNPLANMPYNLDELQDADALFAAHTKWQTAVLKEGKKGVPAIKVETGEGHGLGNRLPGIGTGFVLAVLTGRLFLLQSTVHEHLRLPLPCVWQEHEALYTGVDSCNLGHFTKFVNPDLKFCGGPTESTTATLLQQPCQFDYMLPMFQINPTLKPYFAKFFPDSEVYSRVVRYLFKPKPVLEAALKPYEALSRDCLVGMHLRTKKPGTSAPVEQFSAIARAVAVAKPGSVFVASDGADVFKGIQGALPGRKVWWNEAAASEHRAGNATRAGNPGTELSALTDLILLSKCKNIVLTPASSIGPIAAALAGVAPVYANHGPHLEPFTNPWFWRSVTTEPCFVKAAEVHSATTEIARRFRQEHPLYVYHSQCHYEAKAIGVPAATWECSSAENCREWK